MREDLYICLETIQFLSEPLAKDCGSTYLVCMPSFKHGDRPARVSRAGSRLGYVCLTEQTFLLQKIAFLVDEQCPETLNLSSWSSCVISLFITSTAMVIKNGRSSVC